MTSSLEDQLLYLRSEHLGSQGSPGRARRVAGREKLSSSSPALICPILDCPRCPSPSPNYRNSALFRSYSFKIASSTKPRTLPVSSTMLNQAVFPFRAGAITRAGRLSLSKMENPSTVTVPSSPRGIVTSANALILLSAIADSLIATVIDSAFMVLTCSAVKVRLQINHMSEQQKVLFVVCRYKQISDKSCFRNS
jgi:hypothetical protein